MPIRRHYVDIDVDGDALQLHYREAGNKNNPTLVLLHQSPSHSAMYEPLMRALQHDFHLLAPDTPGFGGSDALAFPAASVADYARAMQGFIAALQLGQVFLFGHHAGAAIAVQLAHDYPHEIPAMALSGPTLLDADLKERLPGLAAPFEETSQGDHLLKMWQRIRGKDEAAPMQLSLRETLSALASPEAYQATYRAVAEQDFEALLPSIGCPVLVFAGDADLLYPSVAPTVELLPRGIEAKLPGGERTYVCERQVDDVAPLLREFFSSQQQGVSA